MCDFEIRKEKQKVDLVVVKINDVGRLLLLLLSASFLFHFQKTHIPFVFCFPSSVRFNTPFVSGSGSIKI